MVTAIKQNAGVGLIDSQAAAHDERVRQRDEPVRHGIGERTQQHGVDDGEDGRGRSEPERECQDRREGEAASVDETPRGMVKGLGQ